jgi:hypothetical protein
MHLNQPRPRRKPAPRPFCRGEGFRERKQAATGKRFDYDAGADVGRVTQQDVSNQQTPGVSASYVSPTA